MRVLIDTNIFIYREDNRVLERNTQRFLELVNRLGIQLVIHPKSREDLLRDPNRSRREISLSKLCAYAILQDAPDPQDDKDFISVLCSYKDAREQIDNAILYAVYRNAVHLLVSEDKELLKKAEKLGIRERVLSIVEAIDLLGSESSENTILPPPAIKHVELHSLQIEDPFFDSLRAEYPGFDNWFIEKSKEGRKSWVYFKKDGGIGALLIYKIEEEEIACNPPQPKKRRLKLCLFKVEHLGFKIGELFTKMSVDLALKNNIEEIYLTHFIKEEDDLVKLISEYGFEEGAVKDNGEIVYIKETHPPEDKLSEVSPLEISRECWPIFYDGAGVRKFIVPIKPEYHEKLFTELRRMSTLFEQAGAFIIEGNTIKKAYLTRTRSKRLSTGDILLFYRTKQVSGKYYESGITSIGIVDEIYYGLDDPEEVVRVAKKRTVYERSEIEDLLPVTVILFTWHLHLDSVIGLSELKENGVIKGPPQSISEISNEGYLYVKEKGGVIGRYTVP